MVVKLYCEGPTERGIRDFLTPQLEQKKKGLGLRVGSFGGIGTLLQKIGRATQISLDQGAHAVFCLIDLRQEAITVPSGLAIGERVERVRDALIERIDPGYRARFYPHVAVYETEAWILADEGPLAKRLRDSSIGPWPYPEVVNDEKPPSVVIDGLFLRSKGSRYRKVKDGVPLLKALDFKKVYSKCPFFRKFVDELMAL